MQSLWNCSSHQSAFVYLVAHSSTSHPPRPPPAIPGNVCAVPLIGSLDPLGIDGDCGSPPILQLVLLAGWLAERDRGEPQKFILIRFVLLLASSRSFYRVCPCPPLAGAAASQVSPRTVIQTVVGHFLLPWTRHWGRLFATLLVDRTR